MWTQLANIGLKNVGNSPFGRKILLSYSKDYAQNNKEYAQNKKLEIDAIDAIILIDYSKKPHMSSENSKDLVKVVDIVNGPMLYSVWDILTNRLLVLQPIDACFAITRLRLFNLLMELKLQLIWSNY